MSARYRRTVSGVLFDRASDGSWWAMRGGVGKLVREPGGWALYAEDDGVAARRLSYTFRAMRQAAREARMRAR